MILYLILMIVSEYKSCTKIRDDYWNFSIMELRYTIIIIKINFKMTYMVVYKEILNKHWYVREPMQ